MIFWDALEETTTDLVQQRDLILVFSLYVSQLSLNLKAKALDVVFYALIHSIIINLYLFYLPQLLLSCVLWIKQTTIYGRIEGLLDFLNLCFYLLMIKLPS